MQKVRGAARGVVASLVLAALLVGCGNVGRGGQDAEPSGPVVLTFNPFGEPATLAYHYQAVRQDESTSVLYCRGVVEQERTEQLVELIESGDPIEPSYALSQGSFVGAVLYFPDGTRIIVRDNPEVIARTGVTYRQSEEQVNRIERELIQLAIQGGCEVYEQDLRAYLAGLD